MQNIYCCFTFSLQASALNWEDTDKLLESHESPEVLCQVLCLNMCIGKRMYGVYHILNGMEPKRLGEQLTSINT